MLFVLTLMAFKSSSTCSIFALHVGFSLASSSQPQADWGESVWADVPPAVSCPLFLSRVTNGLTFISGKTAVGKLAQPYKATLV